MKQLKLFQLLFLLQFPFAVFGQTFEHSVNDYLSANSKVSSVAMTANVKTSDIVNLLRQDLKNPIVNGETPELGFMLHADEAITKERIERQLKTAAKGAWDEVRQIPREVTERVKTGTRIIKNLLKLKFEDIWEDVKKTVYDEVKFHHEAIAAVYEDVAVPFIEINQALVPIKGKFNYSVDLSDVDVVFEGNKYTVVAVFGVNVRTNVFLDGLPQSITPKGNFDSKFKIKVTETGFMEIKDDGSINVFDPTSSLEFVEALGSEFVVDAIDIGSKVTASNYLLDLVGNQVDKQLNKVVKKLIEKNASKINVKDYASKLLKAFDKPIKINDNGFIYPNVTGVFVSQLNGKQVDGQNRIEVKFGVSFQPFATFEASPLPITDKDNLIKFGTELTAGDGINIVLPAFLTYNFVSDQLKPFIADFNKQNENKSIIKKFKIDNQSAKYAQDGNVNLQVELFKRKNNKKIGNINLNARFFATEADTTVCVKVSQVKIKSSNLLVFLAKGLIKKTIIKEAEKNSCKSLAKEVLTASKELNDKLVIPTPLGTIKGQTQSLSLTDILAFPDFVLMKVNLAGTLKLQ
jgi:hypothetical protein